MISLPTAPVAPAIIAQDPEHGAEGQQRCCGCSLQLLRLLKQRACKSARGAGAKEVGITAPKTKGNCDRSCPPATPTLRGTPAGSDTTMLSAESGRAARWRAMGATTRPSAGERVAASAAGLTARSVADAPGAKACAVATNATASSERIIIFGIFPREESAILESL